MEQSLGNANESSNYYLACIKCGQTDKVSLMAHRNKKAEICGLIACCEGCQKSLAKSKIHLSDNPQHCAFLKEK